MTRMGFADNSRDKTDCSLRLFQRISPAPKDKKVALGIAVGGEIEYADEVTLGRSIAQRTEYLL